MDDIKLVDDYEFPDDPDEFPEMSTINQIQLPDGSIYGFEDMEARDELSEARDELSNKADKILATTSADGLMSKDDKAKLDVLANTLEGSYRDTYRRINALANDLAALQNTIANNVPVNSAWAHGRLNGTTVNLMFSHNVESITTSDGHTFYVKFSKPFPDEYYAAVASFEIGGIGQEIVGVYGYGAAGFSVDVQNASVNANTPTCISVIALR